MCYWNPSIPLLQFTVTQTEIRFTEIFRPPKELIHSCYQRYQCHQEETCLYNLKTIKKYILNYHIISIWMIKELMRFEIAWVSWLRPRFFPYFAFSPFAHFVNVILLLMFYVLTSLCQMICTKDISHAVHLLKENRIYFWLSSLVSSITNIKHETWFWNFEMMLILIQI